MILIKILVFAFNKENLASDTCPSLASGEGHRLPSYQKFETKEDFDILHNILTISTPIAFSRADQSVKPAADTLLKLELLRVGLIAIDLWIFQP